MPPPAARSNLVVEDQQTHDQASERSPGSSPRHLRQHHPTPGKAVETFFAGFGELEQEYYRLLGEKEVIQELGTVH